MYKNYINITRNKPRDLHEEDDYTWTNWDDEGDQILRAFNSEEELVMKYE